MSNKRDLAAVTANRPAPVRVRLQRINSDMSKSCPPVGQHQGWWNRLKAAMGTASSDFVNATLVQLQAAARLPNSGVSETAVNSALSLIENTNPRDEMECALVIQIACTHSAAMAVVGRISGGHGSDRHVAMMASAVSRLMRTYAIQVETLRRLRKGSSQIVRVEHVHISEGAQAVIGHVSTN
ncbi:hypothetical protein SAMN05443247_11580 [Bradyrhizobium erythrophlei]|nr:hypothetical protein SAMN05443247_11580 [Bradyrhizobium erythrophlei]